MKRLIAYMPVGADRRQIQAGAARAAMALSVGLMLVLGGCRSSRQATVVTPPTGALTQASLPARAAAVGEACRDWQSVKMPVNIKLTSPSGVSLGGTAIMERDKAVSISLRVMGLVEVGSLTVTADSVKVIDKAHKMYVSESIGDLLKVSGLTVGDLQSLLLGRPFVIGSTAPIDLSGSRLALSGSEGWSVTPADVAGGWAYTFLFGKEDDLRSVTLSREGAAQATVSYSDIEGDTPAGMVAGRSALSVSGRKKIEATVTWKLGRAEWNIADLRYPDVPRGYRRVTMEQVRQMLSAL